VDTDTHDTVSTRLPRTAASAPAARRFVTDTLRTWRLSGAAPTVELLVCELVTNAMLHAGSSVDVRLERRRQRLRVEVTDSSTALPRRQEGGYASEAMGGRGIMLIEELADDWGVDRGASGGKVVWCEVFI
jgi:anti-sigma regulatory factor (Ser/Thr protein kinase)